MKIGDGDSNTIFTSKASHHSSSSSRPLQCEPVCAVRVCVCACVCMSVPSQKKIALTSTWYRKTGLLLVIVLAVKFPFPEVAAGGEGLLTHGTLQTLFVPRGVVDPHQEAVGDGPLAPLTHRGVRAVGSCNAAARVSHVHRGENRIHV